MLGVPAVNWYTDIRGGGDHAVSSVALAAMAVSSSIGGYVAAHTAKRASKTVVHSMIVVIGFSLAAYYFYRQFGG